MLVMRARTLVQCHGRNSARDGDLCHETVERKATRAQFGHKNEVKNLKFPKQS